MAEKPIIFSTEMVMAILDDRKTQTRRVIIPQPILRTDGFYQCFPPNLDNRFTSKKYMIEYLIFKKAKYQVGDKLWVRETFALDNENNVFYKADKADMPLAHSKWKSSRIMPKWAARIWLEVTNVRVEQIQDISENDAGAEGVGYWEHRSPPDYTNPKSTPRKRFQKLWDSINAKRGYSWESNPWVFVYDFKRVQ